MASKEPESQISPLLCKPETFITSSPSIRDPEVFQQAYNDPLQHHSGEELDQQHVDFQPESYRSRVEETQFQPVELDTQAVDDPSFPATYRNSQLREETNSSMARLGAHNDSIQLLSRPNVDDNTDPAHGFTFGVAEKISIGKFNGTAVPARPKSMAEQQAEEGPSGGATKSLPPKVTVDVHTSASSRPTLLREALLSSTAMEPHIGTSGELEGKYAQESPQEEAPSIAIAAQDPQIPISEGSNARLAQKSSNKSHRRIKKPFPEVAGPPTNRRWLGNFSTTNQLLMESPLTHAKPTFEGPSLGIFANVGQTRTFSPGLDEGNDNTWRRNNSSLALDSPRGDCPKLSDRPSDSNAQEQHSFPAKSTRRIKSPRGHKNAACNLNEQEIPSEVVHPLGSGSKQTYHASGVRKQSEALQFTDATLSNSDSATELIAHGKVIVQKAPDNDDRQEEVSNSSSNEVEQIELEEAQITGFQAADHEFENRFAFPIPGRVPPRAPSEASSRPQSRRSNYGKPMMRPVSVQDLRPQGVLESITQRIPYSTKIKKSSNVASNPILTAVSAQRVIGQERQKSRPTAGFFDDYKKFLANGQEYLEVMQDYERQCQLVESQKSEIEKLRDTSETSIKKIKALESEKVDLAEKVKKFTELSSKYKKHMNEVVKAQKYLKIQASEIQKKAAEAIEARKAKETILRKLENAIMDAKSLRVPAEEFANISKQYEKLKATNEKLVSENEKFEAHVEELRNDNEKLTLDNNKLQIDFGAVTRMCKLLQADVEKALIELSLEKFQVEQLERAQGDQPDSLKELVVLLKNSPKNIVEELNKEEGLLAKVLELGKETQVKLNEVKLVSSNDKSQEAELSAAMAKLIEDLFSRFETSMQASNDDATAQQKSNNEILENFKKTVDQLRLDKETEIQLNNRISELRQTNEALALDKNAREREIQESTTQLDQLKQDLADCRGQLSAKNDELATALAALNNDQRLRAEIQDLETANHTVTDQLQSKNQEIAKLKEELSLLQESVRLKDQKIKDWGHRFNEAQSAIKNLNEEKIKCLAKKQQEIEKACQEARRHTAKSAEASKATLKMKLESEVNHLEQKVKEKNAELALAKEELQRARDGNDVHGENANKLQGELALYKEKFIQQIAQIKRLEEQNPGQEAFDRLAENLQSVRSECADLRNYIESIRSENSQNMEVTVRGQQAIEGNLRQVDDLEIEIEKLKENNAELQKRLEISNEAYNQPKALRGGHGDEHRSIGGAKSGQFTTALGIVPSAEQTLKVSQDPTLSSANSERLGSHSIDMNDITLDSHRVGTPEDALRKAAKSIKSHKVVSQFVPATQTSSIRKVGNFETPQIHNVLSKGTVLFSSPHVDSSSASQPQRQGSGTRPLRPAGRKYSKFGQGSGSDAGTHHLSRTETIDQDVQTVYNDNSHYSDATVSQGLLAITPFSEVASNTPTPSPFTDLSSMMDELGSVPNQEQLRKGYEQTRHSNQSEGPVTNDNAPRTVRLHTVAQRTVESLDRNEVAEANDVPRTQGRRNPPSTTEEAIRRRTAQPPKSAIKKPMQVSNADAKSTFAPKTMANTITQSKDSAGARSKDPSQIHGGRRGSYNRAVHSGKPQTPVARIPPVANESSIGALNGKQQSPQNIPLPKRNIPKRSASSIAQTQQAAKRIRTSKAVSFANGDLVPDSQENMQMT